MKKTLFIVFATLLGNVLIAQDQVSVTKSGNEVILHSNGTWTYASNEFCTGFNLSKYEIAKKNISRGRDFNYYFSSAWKYISLEGEKSYNAVVNLEQAIKLNSTFGGYYSDLGNCYRGGFKCYEKADYYYSKAIYYGFSKGFVYYNRAICRYELNKLDDMKSDLEKAKELGWYNDYYKLSDK